MPAIPASACCAACATPSRTAGRTRIEIEEHSHAAMANAYEAGAAGLPCAVFRGYRGAGLAGGQPEHQDRSPARSPARSWPPCRRIRPDVTFIHAQKANRQGRRAGRRHHRRAEGGGAGGQARGGDGRGGRRRFRRPASQPLRPAALDDRRDRRRAGRRASVLRARLLRPRQRRLSRMGRDRRRPRPLPRLDAGERARRRARDLRRRASKGSQHERNRTRTSPPTR